ncbi:hypothetical protein QJS04_geneDACA006224 [Acorus gramineus]|uniref:TFIIS N-terminal domain-containing protein n=1 Tax=Acorus gramineus TaxID=55184 RepID=A0AAV9AV12_ACOGR|nr:hypothetical protein QJS04_geneDACA006224 [Acorus gramineus]
MENKNRKNDMSVESVMAAEEDAKLLKLPRLTEILSKKQFQQEFIDNGLMTQLKKWLECPNISVRARVLEILTQHPLDLQKHEMRQKLIHSGLGKVVMLLSWSNEETKLNQELAKNLIDKWRCALYNHRNPSIVDTNLPTFFKGPKAGQSVSMQQASTKPVILKKLHIMKARRRSSSHMIKIH